MTGSNQASARCKHCSADLEVDHQGPCPHCGEVGKEIIVAVGTAVEIDEAQPVSWVKTREYMEKRLVPATLWAMVTVGSPFLGLLLAGWPGVFVGLCVALVSVLLGYHAVTKVREIERGGG